MGREKNGKQIKFEYFGRYQDKSAKGALDNKKKMSAR